MAGKGWQLPSPAMHFFTARIPTTIASDFSSLIDSPAANNLGFYRALSCSEEQGVMEKFRPYALPSPQWIQQHQKS